MSRRLPLILLSLLLAACAGREPPVVVLISIDGYGATARGLVETPAIDAIAAAGIEAESMRPVFPTLTFPNHYAIATGLYPARHGIVNNRFPNETRDDWYTLYEREKVQDGRWYGGEPLWVAAEREGLTAAAFFFVGTEADIAGIRPRYYYDFDADIPGEARVDQVLDWLALPEAERPRLVTLYFEHVDTSSHRFGPASAEAQAAIRRVDGWIARLVEGLETLAVRDAVNFVIVSDHGQGAYTDRSSAFVVDEHVDLDGLRIVEGGTYFNVYAERAKVDALLAAGETINAAWSGGRCYTAKTAPAAWRVTDDPRFPDLFCVADAGQAIVSSRERIGRLHAGDHGWPPEAESMQAIFIAAGPAIRPAGSIDPIAAVDVYAFVLGLLGIERDVPAERQRLLQFLERE